MSTHYDKMVTDKDDLEKAIADLNTALDDIRAEMLKIFDEGFNIILIAPSIVSWRLQLEIWEFAVETS